MKRHAAVDEIYLLIVVFVSNDCSKLFEIETRCSENDFSFSARTAKLRSCSIHASLEPF